MFCPKCGAQAPDDSSFCPKCGAQLPRDQQPSIPAPTSTPAPTPTALPKASSGANCFAIGCLATLILVGVVTCAVQSGNHTSSPGASTPEHKQAAPKPVPPRSVHAACDAFGKKLNSIEGIGSIVKSYTCRGDAGGPYDLDVTITDDSWSQLDYDQRLQLAKSLWNGWVTAADPSKPDSDYIHLIGEAGEELGGSGFAGSLVDVKHPSQD